MRCLQLQGTECRLPHWPVAARKETSGCLGGTDAARLRDGRACRAAVTSRGMRLWDPAPG